MSQQAVSADIIPNSAVGIFPYSVLIIYSLFVVFFFLMYFPLQTVPVEFLAIFTYCLHFASVQ